MKLFIIALLSLTLLFSQDEKDVISEAEFSTDELGVKEGFKKAKELAIQAAIEKHVGVQVNTAKSSYKSDNNGEIEKKYSSFLQIFSSATVKDDQIIEKSAKFANLDGADVAVYKTKVKMTLVVDEGGNDPGFSLDVNLNKEVYVDGDEMQISIVTSKDAFITVLNFTADQQVYVIHPMGESKQDILKAKKKLLLPSDDDIKEGNVFQLGVEAGKASSTEMIMVIATKAETPLISEHDEATGFEKMSESNFKKWIAGIPLKNRVMDSQFYQIFAKKKSK